VPGHPGWGGRQRGLVAGGDRGALPRAITQCLKIELGVAAVLFVLAYALPRRPRDAQAAGTETAAEPELAAK
jgi:hypothetical protein